jgi:coatomer subunit beta
LQVALNKATAEVLLYLVSILRLGESTALPHPIDDDSRDRITLAVRILSSPSDVMRLVWLKYCQDSFRKMIADKQARETEEHRAKQAVASAQPDDLIDFYHLKSRKVGASRVFRMKRMIAS